MQARFTGDAKDISRPVGTNDQTPDCQRDHQSATRTCPLTAEATQALDERRLQDEHLRRCGSSTQLLIWTKEIDLIWANDPNDFT